MKLTSSGVAIYELLLLALLSTTSSAAEFQGFEVGGRMESISFQRGSIAETNSRTFMVTMRGGELFIRCSAGSLDRGIDYSEFGTDGTSGFHFAQTLLRVVPSAQRRVVADAILHVKPSPVPPWGSGSIQKAWLVYCAQRELNAHTSGFLKPLGFIELGKSSVDREIHEMLNDHLVVRAEWTLNEKEPHALKAFVDYREGKLPSGGYSESLIPAEFMTGRTNSRLDVLSWTNVGGLHLPMHARLTTYITDSDKPGGPLRVRFIDQLVATNVVAGTMRRNFVPRLSSATSVVDYRFAKGPRRPATYVATNGIVFDTAEEAWSEIGRKSDED